MTFALWRSPLATALARNRRQPHSRYLQLATVGLDGKPANRTVVFRGFWDQTNGLQFVSDRRSGKIEQLQNYSWAEGCWYFSQTREQFRILGQIWVITAESPEQEQQLLRQQLWQNLSEPARQQFSWPRPGQAYLPNPELETLTDPSQPSLHFCALVLHPSQVDHLELRPHPHRRWRYEIHEQDWHCQPLNP